MAGGAGRVNHLDTKNFDNLIKTYGEQINRFEELVREVNSITDTLSGNWEGKGKKAFVKDCKLVQVNLKDISDIMYDLRDALIQAHADYIKTDEAVAKSFEM